jgi:hypothetical protein
MNTKENPAFQYKSPNLKKHFEAQGRVRPFKRMRLLQKQQGKRGINTSKETNTKKKGFRAY